SFKLNLNFNPNLNMADANISKDDRIKFLQDLVRTYETAIFDGDARNADKDKQIANLMASSERKLKHIAYLENERVGSYYGNNGDNNNKDGDNERVVE
ncbi:hypothetical protein N0V83_003639, partial [Neocucurbitaria cava]